jgi:hypothetical protein
VKVHCFFAACNNVALLLKTSQQFLPTYIISANKRPHSTLTYFPTDLLYFLQMFTVASLVPVLSLHAINTGWHCCMLSLDVWRVLLLLSLFCNNCGTKYGRNKTWKKPEKARRCHAVTLFCTRLLGISITSRHTRLRKPPVSPISSHHFK